MTARYYFTPNHGGLNWLFLSVTSTNLILNMLLPQNTKLDVETSL